MGKVNALPQLARISPYLASRSSDLLVLVIVLRFYGRLSLSYTPQVPPEHDKNCESDHAGQGELYDVDEFWCIIAPGFLRRVITPTKKQRFKDCLRL